MGNYYSDPTANRALGNVQREFYYRRFVAKELEHKRRMGKLTAEDVAVARRLFGGIFRNLPSRRLARMIAEKP